MRATTTLIHVQNCELRCREAGISRKTSYKILNRYKEEAVTAVSDRSRRPVRYANQLPPQLEAMITGLKRDKPHTACESVYVKPLQRLLA